MPYVTQNRLSIEQSNDVAKRYLYSNWSNPRRNKLKKTHLGAGGLLILLEAESRSGLRLLLRSVLSAWNCGKNWTEVLRLSVPSLVLWRPYAGREGKGPNPSALADESTPPAIES